MATFAAVSLPVFGRATTPAALATVPAGVDAAVAGAYAPLPPPLAPFPSEPVVQPVLPTVPQLVFTLTLELLELFEFPEFAFPPLVLLLELALPEPAFCKLLVPTFTLLLQFELVFELLFEVIVFVDPGPVLLIWSAAAAAETNPAHSIDTVTICISFLTLVPLILT